MGRPWTPEQKQLASEAFKKRSESSKTADVNKRLRINVGAKRDILAIPECPEGYIQRVVNDTRNRVSNLKKRGYELVEEKTPMGTPHVDGNQAYAGVTSRDVGKGMTAYLMRQRVEYYNEDKADKARLTDESEEGMRRKNMPHETSDGTYGEIKIG